MITQKTVIVTTILLTTTTLSAGLINPFSECNIKQAQIMSEKCELIKNGKKYTECENEALKEFFECLKEGDK